MDKVVESLVDISDELEHVELALRSKQNNKWADRVLEIAGDIDSLKRQIDSGWDEDD